MGNCQAAEISAVVIQHPGGKIERLYWPTTAGDIMKSNPGHHVAIVTLCIAQDKQPEADNGSGAAARGHVRFTRVRLLKPKDMLLIGQVYRLVSSQEVSKALKARKLEKIEKAQPELIKKQRAENDEQRMDERMQARGRIDSTRTENQEGNRQQTTAAGGKARHWRPKLQSISEGVG